MPRTTLEAYATSPYKRHEGECPSARLHVFLQFFYLVVVTKIGQFIGADYLANAFLQAGRGQLFDSRV